MYYKILFPKYYDEYLKETHKVTRGQKQSADAAEIVQEIESHRSDLEEEEGRIKMNNRTPKNSCSPDADVVINIDDHQDLNTYHVPLKWDNPLMESEVELYRQSLEDIFQSFKKELFENPEERKKLLIMKVQRLLQSVTEFIKDVNQDHGEFLISAYINEIRGMLNSLEELIPKSSTPRSEFKPDVIVHPGGTYSKEED